MSLAVNKDFIVANLGYRIQTYHRNATVTIGEGNTNADILVVQPHTKMPPKDSITGALKRFDGQCDWLNNSYRATINMVEYDVHEGITHPCLVQNNLRGEKPQTHEDINRYYLRELIEIVDPLIVVACGLEVISFFRGKETKSFRGYAGKRFDAESLPKHQIYATLNPMDYGFARAPRALKERGMQEWERLAEIYQQLQQERDAARWA